MADDTLNPGTDDQALPPQPGSFWDALPPEIRDHKTIAHYRERNDVAGMAQALVHSQAKLGQRPLQLPEPDAPEEERAAFWKQLGRPEEETGYAISYPDGYTATEMERELEPKWQALFHRAHLTEAQAQVLQSGYHEMIGQFTAQLQELENASQADGEATIQRAYPDRRQFEHDERAGLRAAAGGDETAIQVLQELRLSNGALLHTHPAFRMAMARVGTLSGEDGTLIDAQAVHRYSTPGDIDEEIKREHAKAKTDPSHPGHPQTTASRAEQQRYHERMWRMTEQKYAKQSTSA